MVNIDKLNKLASGKSKWMEEAEARQKNKSWLKHSQKIAIKVLMALREEGIKQKQLAERIGVSPQQINKIVKGRENLTLETISKLENALNIKLLFADDTSRAYAQKGKTMVQTKYVYLRVDVNRTFAEQQENAETYFSETEEKEEMVCYG
jgi:transcriptional regulator with XRE-family HTH domain